jgi:hypothetical protein
MPQKHDPYRKEKLHRAIEAYSLMKHNHENE